jgi:secondary thiamine-phosphate synthase enzyme
MKSHTATLSVATDRKQQMLNLTAEVGKVVDASGVRAGFVGVYSQHTTTGVFVSEYQPALIDDIMEFLGRVVQDGLSYKHNSPEFSDCERGNAASHLRSLIFNHGVLLPLADCKPVLGQFQSVILAELDGPRERTLQVHIIGE